MKTKNHIFTIVVLLLIILLGAFAVYILHEKPKFIIPISKETLETHYWEVQAIDTMKFSRDTAREKLNDPSFDIVIDDQVSEIAATGATHVAIATPYDEEFLPFLKRWVAAARKHKLKVWFRGNLAGWEGWFDYPKIDRVEHKREIESFILNNPELFENGDIFVSCPECENGGPGDPRMKGDTEGYRRFLIEEYDIVKRSFHTINKNVKGNYFSMNGDVARLIMDRETTEALDGVVTIDHYVGTPKQLIADIREYVKKSGGKVILGEWGAPIPDINGEMTEEQQAAWLDEALHEFVNEPNLIGHNYWVNRGGSTQLWSSDTQPRQGVAILRKYFKPTIFNLTMVSKSGRPVNNVNAKAEYHSYSSSDNVISVPVLDKETVVISRKGYRDMIVQLKSGSNNNEMVLVMEKENETMWDKILDNINRVLTN